MKMIRLMAALLLMVALIGCNDDDPVAPIAGPPGPAPFLEAEPPFSSGTENTLTWSAPTELKTNEWEFQAQVASDAEFSVVTASSDWISGTTHTFTELIHGSTYHYRVKARGAGSTETEWSAVRASTQDAMAPVSALAELKVEQTSLLFDFELTASDETSGIREVELWVSVDDSEPELAGTFAPGPVRFQTDRGGQHQLIPVAIDGSGNRQDLAQASVAVTLVPEPIIITDLKGEDFDITAAVLEYRMAVPYWEFGVGRLTIRPLIEPLMLAPGDFGYPLDSNTSEMLGVQIEDDVRAYLLGDIRNREVVDDVVNGKPVAVIYCPLCDSFGTYDRVLDGETLTIAASGWTWHRIFVLQDYETGSLWFPGLSFPGQPDFLLCIAGPHQGKKILAVPSHRTLWKPWKQAYPNSLIMKTK
jgi:hypothetical protein